VRKENIKTVRESNPGGLCFGRNRTKKIGAAQKLQFLNRFVIFFLIFYMVISISAKVGETPARLGFSEFFTSGSSRGLVFSEKLKRLNEKSVVISGYMAPPLKPALNFFVLTLQPMAICPFCDSDASWPSNIVVVYLKGRRTIEATTNALQVTGTLDIGRHVDETTGFVSQIRIYADTIEHIR
jgi:hypothetical protein